MNKEPIRKKIAKLKVPQKNNDQSSILCNKSITKQQKKRPA